MRRSTGVLEWQYRRGDALAVLQRALELNPNLADARCGVIFHQNGRPDDATDVILRAKRLDPFHPAIDARWLGTAHHLAGHEGEAPEPRRIAAVREPNYRPSGSPPPRKPAIWTRRGKRRQRCCALIPTSASPRWLDFIRLARPQDAAHLADGLRRAGLPD